LKGRLEQLATRAETGTRVVVGMELLPCPTPVRWRRPNGSDPGPALRHWMLPLSSTNLSKNHVDDNW
jgi:hypothetical protein